MANDNTWEAPPYYAVRNSDQTEGRGHPVVIGIYMTLPEAVEAVQGQGTMGVGDGDIYCYDPSQYGALEVGKAGRLAQPHSFQDLFRRIYGYRKNWAGTWDYGFIDNRDAPTNDPEYAEYKRLQKKFGGSLDGTTV